MRAIVKDLKKVIDLVKAMAMGKLKDFVMGLNLVIEKVKLMDLLMEIMTDFGLGLMMDLG